MKTVGIILGSLVAGAVLGWVCDRIGLSTSITVAVVVALFSAYEAARSKKADANA